MGLLALVIVPSSASLLFQHPFLTQRWASSKERGGDVLFRPYKIDSTFYRRISWRSRKTHGIFMWQRKCSFNSEAPIDVRQPTPRETWNARGRADCSFLPHLFPSLVFFSRQYQRQQQFKHLNNAQLDFKGNIYLTTRIFKTKTSTDLSSVSIIKKKLEQLIGFYWNFRARNSQGFFKKNPC